MINKTNIKIPKKYQPFICDVDFWGNMYSLNLVDACDIDGGSHLYSYDTQKELLSDLKNIYVISSEKRYLNYYGEDLLREYRESYKKITGKYPPKE